MIDFTQVEQQTRMIRAFAYKHSLIELEDLDAVQ